MVYLHDRHRRDRSHRGVHVFIPFLKSLPRLANDLLSPVSRFILLRVTEYQQSRGGFFATPLRRRP